MDVLRTELPYYERNCRTTNGIAVLRTELPYFDPTRDVLQRDVVEHQLAVRPGQFVVCTWFSSGASAALHHLLRQSVEIYRVQAQEAQQLGPDLAGLQRSWSLGIFG